MDALLSDPRFVFFMALLIIWELSWKAIALWHSARNNHKVWFLFILFLSTAGILPIIYMGAVLKKKPTLSKVKVKK